MLIARTHAQTNAERQALEDVFGAEFDRIEDEVYRVITTGLLEDFNPSDPTAAEGIIRRYQERTGAVIDSEATQKLIQNLIVQSWTTGVLSSLGMPTDGTAFSYTFDRPDAEAIQAVQNTLIESFKNTLILDNQSTSRTAYVSTIRGILESSIKDNISVDQTAKILQEKFDPNRDYQRWMYRRIARTEANRMFNAGRLAGLQERAREYSDDVSTKYGRVTNPMACPICLAEGVNSPPQPLDDISPPPYHPNCLCDVTELNAKQRDAVRGGDASFREEWQTYERGRQAVLDSQRLDPKYRLSHLPAEYLDLP